MHYNLINQGCPVCGLSGTHCCPGPPCPRCGHYGIHQCYPPIAYDAANMVNPGGMINQVQQTSDYLQILNQVNSFNQILAQRGSSGPQSPPFT